MTEMKIDPYDRHTVLDGLFEMVRDPKDWKAPINWHSAHPLPLSTIKAICASILYFTGTIPEVDFDGNGCVIIQAIGYRMGDAGDH